VSVDLVWAAETTGSEVANYIGYASANRALADALRRQGARLWRRGEQPASCRTAVHFMFPERFVPVEGVRDNVLFTMFESHEAEAMMTYFAPAFSRCSLVVTPSAWCSKLFAHYTSTPVVTCPLGVDAENFPYKRRRWTPGNEPFVWLYVGAPNRRKWTILPEIWEHFLATLPPGFAHLYIKTTGALGDVALRRMAQNAREPIERFDFPTGSMFFSSQVTVDTRLLPRAELAAEVYHRAHGQIFLHCGEGWGLTGLEGMATGLPLVVSDSTGTREFATRETAYPVGVTVRNVHSEATNDATGEVISVENRVPWPNDTDAVDALGRVMLDYRRAQIVGRRASERAREFPWSRAASTLLALLRQTG